MGVVNSRLNRITYYDVSTGEDALRVAGSSATVTPLPLPTDGKYMILAHCPAASTYSGTNADHWFQILQGDEGWAWQRELGDLTFKSTDDVSTAETADYILGPFESARFVAGATAASTARGIAAGDPVLRIRFAAAATGSTASADDNEFPAAETNGQANITIFKLPQVEYTT